MLEEAQDELKLVTNILDKLSREGNGLRRDQVEPLLCRLSKVSEQLKNHDPPASVSARESEHPNKSIGACSSIRFSSDAAGIISAPLVKQSKAISTIPSTQTKASALLKASSVKSVPIPRQKIPSDSVKISKEVAQSITSTLYNILESTTTLLQASAAHIFIRQDDEMVSIVNVSRKLSFPPSLVRHRTMGSSDAEVLGSGIALNQRMSDASTASTSTMIFPIFMVSNGHERKSMPVATIRVENKLQGSSCFDEIDECILYFSSCLIGELMSRVPQMDWLSNFYDPITQHIVCPFEPASILPLPSVQKPCSQIEQKTSSMLKKQKDNRHSRRALTKNVLDSSLFDSKVEKGIDKCVSQILIKREALPETVKQPSCGRVQMPTLREVRSFLKNIEDCWKESVSSSVQLTEAVRESEMEVRQLRFALQNSERKNAELIEKLRLYELGNDDYHQEYKAMKNELESYLKKQEKLDVL